MSCKSKRGIGYGKKRIKKKNDHKLLKSLFALGALSASAVASAVTCPQPGVTEMVHNGSTVISPTENYCSNIVVGGSFIWTTEVVFTDPNHKFSATIIAGQDLIGYLEVFTSSGPSGSGQLFYFDAIQAGGTLNLLLDGKDNASPGNPDAVSISVAASSMPDNSPFQMSSVVPVPSAVWLFGSGLIGLVGLARRKA